MNSKLTTLLLQFLILSCLKLSAQKFNDEKLVRSDYSFLSNEEFKFASESGKFHIESDKFTWSEYEEYSLDSELQRKVTSLDLLYKESELNNIEGKLTYEDKTYELFGSVKKNESGKYWATLRSADGLKGIIYWYLCENNDEIESIYDVHIAEINIEGKRNKIKIVPSSASFYNDYELELISEASKYKFDTKGCNFTEYIKDTVSLKYSSIQATNNENGYWFEKVNGILSIGKSNYAIYGLITYSEGTWGHASLWENDINKGLITWEASKDSDSSFAFVKYCREQGKEKCEYEKIILLKSSQNILFRKFDNTETGKSKGSRKKITSLDFEDFKVLKSCIVHLVLLIDKEGNVIKAENDPKKSTTTDKNLIDDIIDKVMTQIKYEKCQECSVQKQFLAISLTIN